MKDFDQEGFQIHSILSLVIAVLFGLAVIAMAGCASSGETVIDRYKADCDATGGTWTTIGCIYTLPWTPTAIERDCIEAGGVPLPHDDCSVRVME